MHVLLLRVMVGRVWWWVGGGLVGFVVMMAYGCYMRTASVAGEGTRLDNDVSQSRTGVSSGMESTERASIWRFVLRAV